MRLSDFKGIFKKSDIILVKKENIGKDYWCFDFTVPRDNQWEAGEHGAFIIKNPKIKGKSFRAFSVASIYEEGFLRIVTRTGATPSLFKQALIDMKIGHSITLRGPFGWFKLPPIPSPVVIIVGGVGFAPARSLIKSLEKENSYPTKLIYISDDIFLYQEEMERICKDNSALTVTYHHDRDLFNKDIKATSKQNGNKAYYYISGSPSMIKGLKKLLKEHGIKRSRVVSDPFVGY